MQKIIAICLISSVFLWTASPFAIFAEGETGTVAPQENASADSAEAENVVVPGAGIVVPGVVPIPDNGELGTDVVGIADIVKENLAAASSTESSAGTTTEEILIPATSTIETANTTVCDESLNSATSAEVSTSTLEADNAAAGLLVDNAATSTTSATTTATAGTSTIDSAITADSASSTINSTSTLAVENATTTTAAERQFEVLAQWLMSGEGLDDDPAQDAQIAPSGEFQLNKNFKFCAVAGGETGAIEGVYGQLFYPKGRGFALNDSKGRRGFGQVAGPACKMQKIDAAAGFDLLCEKIQKNNSGLPTFAQNHGFGDICGGEKILTGTVSVYCCDRALAYDDIAGDYEAAVMAKGIAADYSNMLSAKFSYLPLAELEVDFDNIYYGKVRENIEAMAGFGVLNPFGNAAETISKATIRNVGNVRASVSLWQDDMGLEKTDEKYNVGYAARVSGIDAAWVDYLPFETTIMPNQIEPGQSVKMEFLVKVLNFPDRGDGKKNYAGQMRIEAVGAGNYVFNGDPADNPAALLEEAPVAPGDTIIAKPETEAISDTAATTDPAPE